MEIQKDNSKEWQKLKIESQQKEIEELKNLKAAAEFLLAGEKNKNKFLSNWMAAQKEENTKLIEDLAIHKGISDGKDIIIKQLEEEIRMLKQYQQIAINDKHHRKKRLNKALEEIKQLKNQIK